PDEPPGTALFSNGFFQAEDGIRDLRMSRGLGDVYKRQEPSFSPAESDMLDDTLCELSLIHISEPTRHAQISYAVFCLKKP
ncbi:hypothetical protein, partial [Staphylococcus aureus]